MAAIPTAHTFTCLRIAGVVTHVVARLITDLRVCALAGRDSHPLDRSSEFQSVSDHVPPSGPALTGRFHFGIPSNMSLCQGNANTHTVEPRFGGLRSSGTRGAKLRAWNPPSPTTSARYCFPSTA